MKYIPAGILLALGCICWLMSLGNKEGAAMSSSFMVLPAMGFGLMGVLAAVAAWAL